VQTLLKCLVDSLLSAAIRTMLLSSHWNAFCHIRTRWKRKLLL